MFCLPFCKKRRKFTHYFDRLLQFYTKNVRYLYKNALFSTCSTNISHFYSPTEGKTT